MDKWYWYVYKRLVCYSAWKKFYAGAPNAMMWMEGVVNSLCKYHLSSAGYLLNVRWGREGTAVIGREAQREPICLRFFAVAGRWCTSHSRHHRSL